MSDIQKGLYEMMCHFEVKCKLDKSWHTLTKEVLGGHIQLVKTDFFLLFIRETSWETQFCVRLHTFSDFSKLSDAKYTGINKFCML